MKLKSLFEVTEKTEKDAFRIMLVLQDMFDEFYDLPYKIKIKEGKSILEVHLLDSYQTITYSVFPAFWHIAIQIQSPNFVRMIENKDKNINHEHFKKLTDRAINDICNEYGWHQEFLNHNPSYQEQSNMLKAVISCIRDRKVSSFEDFRLIYVSNDEYSDEQCRKIEDEFDSTIIYDFKSKLGYCVLLAKIKL